MANHFHFVFYPLTLFNTWTNYSDQIENLTTPMAKADGVLFRKHPTYNLPYEGAEVELLANNSW